MDNFMVTQKNFVEAVNVSRISGRMLQATLLEGDSKFVLDKAIQYLVLTLFCEEVNPPCLRCKECLRVFNDTVSDVVIYDLNIEGFRKENILQIQKNFSQTALEKSGKQVYIIKNIEKANSIALNSLLKFLEEPKPNVYAIFTTNNTDKVLDTIVSRTNVYRIKSQEPDVILAAYEGKYPRKSIELALQITHDEVFIEHVLQSEAFNIFETKISEMFLSLIDKSFYIFAYENLVHLDRVDMRIFLELFYVCFTNPTNLTFYGFSDSIENFILGQSRYTEILDKIISIRLKLETNTSLSFILDEFLIELEDLVDESR